MTANGKIDIFANDSISVHSNQDLNFKAERDINLEAGRNTNIKSATMHTESNTFEIKASASGFVTTGAEYHLNVVTINWYTLG